MLPFIFMTEGSTIHVRFPKADNAKNVIVGVNGELPLDAYQSGTPSQVALEWADEFPHVKNVFPMGDFVNVVFRFAKFEDALDFKNNFMLNVHGVK